MEVLAEKLDESLNGDLTGGNRENGFVLIAFPFGEHTDREQMFCISSLKHEQLADLLEEEARVVRSMGPSV